MAVIDHEARDPAYVQLAAIIRGQIESGELERGRPIPSESTLIQTYELSRGTVRRAVDVLRREGLVETVPGRRSYVL